MVPKCSITWIGASVVFICIGYLSSIRNPFFPATTIQRLLHCQIFCWDQLTPHDLLRLKPTPSLHRSTTFFFWGDVTTLNYANALLKLVHPDSCSRNSCPLHKFLFRTAPSTSNITPLLLGVGKNNNAWCASSDMACLARSVDQAISKDVLLMAVPPEFYLHCTSKLASLESGESGRHAEVRNLLISLTHLFPGKVIIHSTGLEAQHGTHFNESCVEHVDIVVRNATLTSDIVTYLNVRDVLFARGHAHDDGIENLGNLGWQSNRMAELILQILECWASYFADTCRTPRSVNKSDGDNSNLAAFLIDSHRNKTMQHCANFTNYFTQTHGSAVRRIQANTSAFFENGGKVLIFKPHLKFNQGFADRMSGLTKAFLIAFCSNRTFFVDWPHIENMFISDPVNFTFPVPLFREYNITRIVNEYDESPLDAHIDYMSDDKNSPIISIHFNRAASWEALFKSKCSHKLQNLDVTLDVLFGCTVRLMGPPQPSVISPFSNILVRVQAGAIGVHYRYGDHTFKHPSMDVSLAAASAQMAQRTACFRNTSLPLHFIFLMTDNNAMKANASQLSSSLPVITTQVQPQHVAAENLPHEAYTDTLAEWFIFSLCSMHIVDKGSGFSRTSYAYSLSDNPVILSRDGTCHMHFVRDMALWGAKL